VRRVERRPPGFRPDYTSKPNMNNFTKFGGEVIRTL
jgi:hypothetical protein